jgi:ketosteroid isomerase-like protein
MDEAQEVVRVALQIADAIARKDADTIVTFLASGFVQRTPGGESRDAATFARGIREIPVEIVFVRLDDLAVDLSGAGALVTGIQHARVVVDGKEVDDRRAFVDWFVKEAGAWRIRTAVDVPAPEPASV